MKLRYRIYNFWLTYEPRIIAWLLVINLAVVPLFLILYWLGVVPYLPFGSAGGECGSGPLKYAC